MQQRLAVKFNRQDIREAFLMLSECEPVSPAHLFLQRAIESRFYVQGYIPRPSRPRLFLGADTNVQAAFINAWMQRLSHLPLPLACLQALVDEWDVDDVAAVLRPMDNITVHRCVDRIDFWGLENHPHRVNGFAGESTNIVGAMLTRKPIILVVP